LQKKSYYQKFRNSKVRHSIWPIRSSELFKFTPMVFLMFAILLNQNIVRSLKDSLVMTLVSPEVINFIKLWGEMPIGLLFVAGYSYLCNKFNHENAFRVVVLVFLIFYFCFAFILFPNADAIHPDANYIEFLINKYPHLKWFIVMWGKWSFVLMYILGELWPVVVFSLLFWQLANKITKVEEASRFYPFFSIFGQANCLIAGSLIMYFTSRKHFLMPLFPSNNSSLEIMVKSLCTIVILSGLLILIIHRYIEVRILRNYEPTKIKKEKQKVSFLQSIKLIGKNPYIRYIAIILFSYSFIMNMIEGVWMFKTKEIYSTPQTFAAYQGRILFWTGVVTITGSLIGSNLMRKMGWLLAAILTPFAALLTGVLFYSVILGQNILSHAEYFGDYQETIKFVVLIGAIQFVFTKGLKYSLYDATKEIAYIPLDDELKTKGKASADILGAKVGKSAGAIIQIFIFSFFPSVNYNDISGVLMMFFILVCGLWIYAVVKLSKKYNDLTGR